MNVDVNERKMFQILIFLAAPDVSTGRRRNTTRTTVDDMKAFFPSGEMLVPDEVFEEEVATDEQHKNRKETKEVHIGCKICRENSKGNECEKTKK